MIVQISTKVVLSVNISFKAEKYPIKKNHLPTYLFFKEHKCSTHMNVQQFELYNTIYLDVLQRGCTRNCSKNVHKKTANKPNGTSKHKDQKKTFKKRSKL